MKPLIRNQSIRIDSHQRGDGRPMDISSVHLHKTTKRPIDGRRQTVDIEIPLCGNKLPSIVVGTKKKTAIPSALKKEIQEVLSKPKRIISFAKEVANILQNYSEWQPEQLVESLQNIAKGIGINWTENQVYTFSDAALGKVCYLQLFDKIDNHWYCLKTNKLGLQVEDTMSTIPIDYSANRYIIANVGCANNGKSSSLKQVFEILSNKYPTVILKDGYDIKAVIEISGHKVGIETQGDPGSRMLESLDDFEQMRCDIILTACRTRGETYDKVLEMSRWYNYKVIFAPNLYNIDDSIDYDKLNRCYATDVVRLLEELL